ncbi:MAG: asparagine synthase (glutamine-hydrolyzing) [Acidobacteriota bacterium]|nr:asparagine synthase (glutamine-hydrolyzing) [Acidobacteriota bacterium]
MCGFAGFTHNSRGIDESVIRRATESLTHRGPDQQGFYWSSDAALGAVRLQVIDLEGGEQPMRSDDGRTIIVYNGEIYNFREVRRNLELRGHRFVSDCDTEVALRAFLEWDTRCFEKFRGMFALAIWSERDKRLVLARDRMGIKPLYIRHIGRDIVFGSELKAIFTHPRVTRRLDQEALQDFLSLGYVPSPRTLVEGIEKLPSGHYLEWRNGVSNVEPWWALEFRPDKTIRTEDAVVELDGLLRDSVREHLVSDVPLGIWASGGVDSSTLLHYAAELGARPLKTFSIAFEAKSCDERGWFREVAKLYGTEHHEFELNRESEVASAIEEFSWYSDEPGADSGALPVWFLSKMSRKHVTVALSGEGGDELFGGYMTYRADRIARSLRRVPRLLRDAALGTARTLLPVSNAKIGFEYKVKRLLEGSLLNGDESHLFWNGSFSQAQKQRLLPGLNGHHLHRLYDIVPRASDIGFLNRFLMLDQQYYLQDNLLYKVDRMSMAHSLEVRPPFLDHRIVEFAGRLPEKLKMNGSQQKIILKKTMQGKLPQSILDRKKSGLDIPAHEWFRGPLLPLLRDTLTPEAIRRTHLFNPDATESLIRDHRDKRINAGYHLWSLLTLFLWLKRWNIETGPRAEQQLSESVVYAAAS